MLRRYTRNSGRTQGDRTVKWRAVNGKLLLDLGKKGVYTSYPRTSYPRGYKLKEYFTTDVDSEPICPTIKRACG